MYKQLVKKANTFLLKGHGWNNQVILNENKIRIFAITITQFYLYCLTHSLRQGVVQWSFQWSSSDTCAAFYSILQWPWSATALYNSILQIASADRGVVLQYTTVALADSRAILHMVNYSPKAR